MKVYALKIQNMAKKRFEDAVSEMWAPLAHLLNHAVVRQRDAVAVDLAIPALVDELLHGLQVGVAPGDVGLHAAQHVDGGLVHLHEHAVVDLAQPEQLQDLAGLSDAQGSRLC